MCCELKTLKVHSVHSSLQTLSFPQLISTENFFLLLLEGCYRDAHHCVLSQQGVAALTRRSESQCEECELAKTVVFLDDITVQ